MTNYRWNNFPGWLPGGNYRSKPDTRSRRLIADLDIVLDEQNFDLPHFQELERIRQSYFQEARTLIMNTYRIEKRELFPEEEKRTVELKELENQVYTQLDALLEPVIRGMENLGYTIEDLRQ